MTNSKLQNVAQQMVAPGKGILAADESIGTIGKRFEKINLENTHENRTAWRTLLFSTPGLEQYISGAIQYDETIRDGLLQNNKILSIIKVDEGIEDFALKPMPGLAQRLEEYKTMGAVGTKARALLTIGNERIELNVARNNEYAKACQDAGLVPIVEPEVLMDGEHTMAICEEVTARYFNAIFAGLRDVGVDLAGIVFKPSMIVPGKASGQTASPHEVAEAMVRVIKAVVPPEVPGIAFLSGGQTEEEATANLKAIQAMGPFPWRITFSFGRALQDSALKIWAGKSENTVAAQQKLLERAKANAT